MVKCAQFIFELSLEEQYSTFVSVRLAQKQLNTKWYEKFSNLSNPVFAVSCKPTYSGTSGQFQGYMHAATFKLSLVELRWSASTYKVFYVYMGI